MLNGFETHFMPMLSARGDVKFQLPQDRRRIQSVSVDHIHIKFQRRSDRRQST
jgi:hypothetical protein